MLGFLVIFSFIFCMLSLFLRLMNLLNSPFKGEIAPSRLSAQSGILYAFTLGMAPWAKESTRRHWVLYLRGMLFHMGVFISFFILLLSPWIHALGGLRYILTFLLAIGFAGGFLGFYLRIWGKEKALSTPDDYASLLLVTLFILTALAFSASDAWLPPFYLITSVMFLYIPFSKIRHFLYFFFSRFFFGARYGRRGIVGFQR